MRLNAQDITGKPHHPQKGIHPVPFREDDMPLSILIRQFHSIGLESRILRGVPLHIRSSGDSDQPDCNIAI
jgi:hypothetical protein